MILVLLGTQDQPFERLLKSVSNQIKKGKIKDKVIAQVGCTKFVDKKIEMFDFCSKEEIEVLIKKAKYVICHAGVGTITECIKSGKKVIVVPRLKDFKEHANDHQVQITKEFAEKGYILPVYNIRNLGKTIDSLRKFKPLSYESNNEKFKKSLIKYINL